MLRLLDPTHALRASMTDGDATFLGEFMDHLHQLFAALLGERRNRNANDVAVVGGREPEVRGEDSLLHRLEESFVPRLYREHLGLGRGDAGDLAQRHLVPVRFDAHEIEQRGRRFASAHGREVALHRFDRLVHELLAVLDVLGECRSWSGAHWTIVPTRSPARTLAVAPGWLMLNTTMGSLFSLHNPKALASITA